MALRPMLFASSVAPLREAAAMRDASLVERVVEIFRPNLHDLARREATALFAGDSAGKPESEEQIHVVAALARVLGVQRNEAMIADGDWADRAWEDYFRGVQENLDDRARALFGLLAQQKRPLFGSSIQTTWAYYGYLLLDEVRELLAALERLEQVRPEVVKSPQNEGKSEG